MVINVQITGSVFFIPEKKNDKLESFYSLKIISLKFSALGFNTFKSIDKIITIIQKNYYHSAQSIF